MAAANERATVLAHSHRLQLPHIIFILVAVQVHSVLSALNMETNHSLRGFVVMLGSTAPVAAHATQF